MDALFEAVRSRKSQTVRELLRGGADPNTTGPNGTTPLVEALTSGKRPFYEIVETLVEYGADPYQGDAMDRARARDCDDLIQWIERYVNIEKYEEVFGEPGHRLVPLSVQTKMMISITRQTVGGRVLRLDVELEDGTPLRGLKVIEELFLLVPDGHDPRTISKVSVPFEQH